MTQFTLSPLMEQGSNFQATDRGFFPSLLLPDAYDGELLYSWGARFHRLSGNRSARETSRQLFGNSTAGLRQDFYGCLDEFQRRTIGHLGASEAILLKRSLAAFYLPFMSVNKENRFRQFVMQGSGASARRLLGLMRSGFSSPSLKACPDCLQEDLRELPTAWWRTHHQWPTSFICYIHQRPLMAYVADLRRSSLANWYLPTLDSRHYWLHYRIHSTESFELLLKLERWVDAVIGNNDLRFEGRLLRHTYLLQAKTWGWLSADGALRFRDLRDAFLKQHAPLLEEPTFDFIRDVRKANFGFLGLLLRQNPRGHHPLRHFLLMAFLFPTLDDFLRSYSEVTALWNSGGQKALNDQLGETYLRLRSLVGDSGVSVTFAAKTLGIHVKQAVRHLGARDVDYQRRPRIVGTNTENQLIEMLKRGDSRSQIVQLLGIRKSFLKDYLGKNPELKKVWKCANFESERSTYRSKLLSTLAAYPTLPIKRIRLIPGNGFQWLYNNDREWLQEQLPALWKRNAS